MSILLILNIGTLESRLTKHADFGTNLNVISTSYTVNDAAAASIRIDTVLVAVVVVYGCMRYSRYLESLEYVAHPVGPHRGLLSEALSLLGGHELGGRVPSDQRPPAARGWLPLDDHVREGLVVATHRRTLHVRHRVLHRYVLQQATTNTLVHSPASKKLMKNGFQYARFFF